MQIKGNLEVYTMEQKDKKDKAHAPLFPEGELHSFQQQEVNDYVISQFSNIIRQIDEEIERYSVQFDSEKIEGQKGEVYEREEEGLNAEWIIKTLEAILSFLEQNMTHPRYTDDIILLLLKIRRQLMYHFILRRS